MALPFMPLLLKLKFKIFKVLCFFDFCVKGNSLETSLKQFLFKSYHPQPSFLYTLNQFLTIFTRSVAGAAGHGSFSLPPPVEFFYCPPSSRSSSCVRTDATVMCLYT